MGTIKVTCSKCGKDFDLDEKWKGFAEKYPDRVTCKDCKSPSTKKTETSSTSKPAYTKSASSTKAPVSAEMFVKAYDELVAAFADRKDEVKEYLGGWASTIVINRSR